ncbi:MAG TPA: pyridoxamine 5'-phosphate oxidase family protein [Pirellulaceae bacterium]|nr:pyridoxamine 5'-phosphate oxidase family protein [Pirellulaceae bacterium]HMO94075.1 pyridoxamine 5'-phosphate oxidase family protein [Pirellulaceae bacterium]HMP70917.1 pyridoxamine 5'-phosphate oxidase family protein [Pirellulaceae bacterium]
MNHPPSDIAFTPAVKSIQSRKGSRQIYERKERGGGWQTKITTELASFINGLDMFYFGTANRLGQPYIQYRGGAPGFLRVLDESTLGFADFRGNRQYISLGNLSENPQAFIFLMDYMNSKRIKIWGTARVVEDDSELLERLRDENYPGKIERAITFTITTWDVNCPQHIHRRYPHEHVENLVRTLQDRIIELEAKLGTCR